MTLPINGQYGEISVKNDGGQRKPFEKIEARRSRRKRGGKYDVESRFRFRPDGFIMRLVRGLGPGVCRC